MVRDNYVVSILYLYLTQICMVRDPYVVSILYLYLTQILSGEKSLCCVYTVYLTQV